MMIIRSKEFLISSLLLITNQAMTMGWVCDTADKARKSVVRLVTCCSGRPIVQKYQVSRNSMQGLFSTRYDRRVSFAISMYHKTCSAHAKPLPILTKFLMKEICDRADVMELSRFSQDEKNEGLKTIIDSIGVSDKKIYLSLFEMNYHGGTRLAQEQKLCQICQSYVAPKVRHKILWMVPLLISAGADVETVIKEMTNQLIQELTKKAMQTLIKNYGHQ